MNKEDMIEKISEIRKDYYNSVACVHCVSHFESVPNITACALLELLDLLQAYFRTNE